MTNKATDMADTLLKLTDDLRVFADDVAFICDAIACLQSEFSTMDGSSQSGARQHLEHLKFKAGMLAGETRKVQESIFACREGK
ncbi:MAG: hypothetical protein K6L73_06370 [Cellvibrionaceae bacterium]